MIEQAYFTHTGLRYAAYAALASLTCFTIFYFSGANPIGAISWMSAWVPVVMIILGIKHYQKQMPHVPFGYGRAFRMGLNITLSWAFLVSAAIFICGTTVMPGLLELQKEEALLGAEEVKSLFSEELYDQSINAIENTTMGSIAFNDFFMKLVGGVISSLIIAAFMKREIPPQAIVTEDLDLNEQQ